MSNGHDNASSNVISENDQKEYRSNRFSIGFHLLLPVAGLSLLILGRRQIFENILLQLDRKYLSVICPSFIKKENILKWANSRLPPTWSSPSTKTLSGGIQELWMDGSLLCTLINTAVPGACPNPHRHWKQSPVHGQNLAYKYFGIVPIFTDEDLKRSFNSSLERKFIPYLNRIQNSVNKVSESIEKETKISSRYIVRGMGLFSGEQHKEATFYIYLNEEYEDDGDKEENIIIQIKGPFGTYGEVVAPKIVNKKRKRINKRKEGGRRQSIQFIENFIQSNTWNFTRAQKKNINDGIDIETMMEKERIRVTYTPTDYGMYEINMLCGTELVKGCPFNVHIFINEMGKNTEMKKEIHRKHRKPVKKIEPNILPNLLECEEIKKSVKLKAVKILNIEESLKNVLDTSLTTETSNFNILHSAHNTNEEVTAKEKETVFKHIECSDLVNKTVENVLELISLDDSKNFTNNNSCKHLLNDDSNLKKSNKSENIKISQNLEIVKTNDGKQFTEEEVNKVAKILQEISTPNNENNDLDSDITDGSSKINTVNRPSIFANKNIINTSENSQMESNHKSFTIKPKYINNLHVDKIKIPEMFTVDTMKNHTLEDKYFKNIFNESNKVTKQNPNLEVEDFQKYRQRYTNFDLNKNENKVKADSNIYSQTLPKYNQDTFFGYHSPEEANITMTAAEKRNKFSKTKSSKGAFSSSLKNSSLSDENKKQLIQETEPSRTYSPAQRPLKIQKLTYPNDNSIESCTLCNAASLPNLSTDLDYSFVMSVKDRKQFWENYSPRSLSSNSTKSMPPKKIRNFLSDTERSKLIWSKSKDDFPESVYPIENIFKSADDILSLTNLNEDYIKYNSTDDSLDNYEFLSIEERKLRLLKKFNRNENTSDKEHNRYEIIKNKIIKSLDKPKDLLEKETKNINFTPLSEKIRKYHSALELSTNSTTEPSISNIENIKNISAYSLLPIDPNAVTTENTLKVYSHFKKAINYFKKLESQSPDKIVKPKKKLKRPNDRKALPSYKSGSLNIPKISQTFFIDNLYQDVFGNKSNFKGMPNKSAVVEALATFPRNRSKFYDNEDNIEYDIFKKVTKTRKRKSLKSIFDIHY